jgi:hypothetical protein
MRQGRQQIAHSTSAEWPLEEFWEIAGAGSSEKNKEGLREERTHAALNSPALNALSHLYPLI